MKMDMTNDSASPQTFDLASQQDSGSRSPKTPGTSARTGRVAKKHDSTTALACNHCRLKKVKCVIELEGCRKCKRLNIPCVWPSEDKRKCPSSKNHIRELYQRIADLESALESAKATQNFTAPTRHQVSSPQTPSTYSALSVPIPSQEEDNLISRLCGRQWKLNSDEEGQYKFFGPTSSLHLTESVSSSLLGPWSQRGVTADISPDDPIDPGTQTHLLENYWKYQHTVLQVFDREEFLEGMKTRQTKYFSKALLYCVYACAARISDRPSVRAMVIPSNDDMEDKEPFLVATATRLVDQELKRPQITTIQALLLLSVIHCSLSKDTKGWLLTGDACRLAIDLGLHRTGEKLASTNFSPRDMKVRQITYWGCLVFDRLWALYLGRPSCLKCEDTELRNSSLTQHDASWEKRIAFSSVTLLLTVGRICDALNEEQCDTETLHALDEQLQDWYQNLDPELRYCKEAHPSILVLHMQYYSCKIHLHRPTANFGVKMSETDAQCNISRQICIDNAKNIATTLQDYRNVYGDASTLSGVALHVIATASTILIADIAERRSADGACQFSALKTCVRTLSELEKTYIVARRVRRIIQLVMRLCHFESEYVDFQQANEVARNPANLFNMVQEEGADRASFQPPNDHTGLPSLSAYSPLCIDDFLPISSQFDIMYSLESL
ncbi:Fungal specific transcription factor domain-containing protein [Cladophialophora immunda]|nr:Fungal specific transcription factor domain-containing protein [Cladophialophora immunda]